VGIEKNIKQIILDKEEGKKTRKS